MKVWHFTEQSYVPGWSQVQGPIRIHQPSNVIDPDIASDILNRHLDEWILADELGLDIMVNEHHTTLSCLSPSVMMQLSILARQTSRARLLSLGIPIANRMDPFRIVEEVALVDVISRGRLELGLVKGVPFELFSSNANPARMMERFWEAHDLILEAMTRTDGPFSWEGKYFQYRNVNVWPRVYQQPHPPIWMPSGSSRSAVDIGRKGYVLATFMVGYHAKTVFEAYRRGYAETHPEPPPPDRFGYLGMAVVGRSEAQARERANKMASYLPTLERAPPATYNPAGYMSVNDNVGALKRKGPPPKSLLPDGSPLPHSPSLDELAAAGVLFWGTPDEVFRQIAEFYRGIGGFGHFLMEGQASDLSHAETADSLKLFAAEVYPRLKELKPPEAPRVHAPLRSAMTGSRQQ